MEEQVEVSRIRRRQYSAEFKAEVVKACMRVGESIPAVARRYQLNAKLLRRWIAACERRNTPLADTRTAEDVSQAEFVPLCSSGAAVNTQEITIELKRGATTATVRWPCLAAAQCAGWLQGWLR